MVYAFIQDVPIGEDIYRTIIDALGPDPMKGSLLHLAVRRPEGGLRYIDVWESEEDSTRAFQERIHPAVDAALGGNRPASRARSAPPGRAARYWLVAGADLVVTHELSCATPDPRWTASGCRSRRAHLPPAPATMECPSRRRTNGTSLIAELPSRQRDLRSCSPLSTRPPGSANRRRPAPSAAPRPGARPAVTRDALACLLCG